MLQQMETYNLRMALDEALRSNDDLAREVQKLEIENYADQICGSWRLSDAQIVHIRKTATDQYSQCQTQHNMYLFHNRIVFS